MNGTAKQAVPRATREGWQGCLEKEAELSLSRNVSRLPQDLSALHSCPILLQPASTSVPTAKISCSPAVPRALTFHPVGRTLSPVRACDLTPRGVLSPSPSPLASQWIFLCSGGAGCAGMGCRCPVLVSCWPSPLAALPAPALVAWDPSRKEGRREKRQVRAGPLPLSPLPALQGHWGGGGQERQPSWLPWVFSDF